MMTCIRFAILLCIALAASTGAAGQAGPAAAPSSSDASVAGPDVTLVNVDLSDTPFNSVQVCSSEFLLRVADLSSDGYPACLHSLHRDDRVWGGSPRSSHAADPGTQCLQPTQVGQGASDEFDTLLLKNTPGVLH